MADVTPTAASVRSVADDPEDALTMDAASGYTPALGDVVAISGNDEVDLCDATDANVLVEPLGVVKAIQAIRTSAGAAGYRVTVMLRGILEGFTGLTAKTVLYNSTTPGAFADADPTASGVTGKAIAVALNATQVYVAGPSL